VLDDTGVRVRDLPRLTGVSKEAIAMSLGRLTATGHVVVESDPAGTRTKLARLTPKGRTAQGAYRKGIMAVEEQWNMRHGGGLANLRNILQRLVSDPPTSPLWQGLEPYPDGWRATVRKPDTLPHYPMVLHRGGYPDGS
jgi:DNA-binding HxlR family transcriptional regulator